MFNRSFSKTMLLGNVGSDPKIRYSQNGGAVANLSVVTTKSVKNKATGNYENKNEWHQCVAFGRLAENIGKHIKKGVKVYLEGEIETSSYPDKDRPEITRYSTNIIITGDFQEVANSKSSSPSQEATPTPQPSYQQPTPPLEPQ